MLQRPMDQALSIFTKCLACGLLQPGRNWRIRNLQCSSGMGELCYSSISDLLHYILAVRHSHGDVYVIPREIQIYSSDYPNHESPGKDTRRWTVNT